MSERNRVLLLIFIMATACLTVSGGAIFLLYRTAFDEERARLVETAQSQARLIEAVARFDAIHTKDYPEGSEKATLSQIVDAHEHYKGFGKTGEFTLARHEKDHIVFLLSHRHLDLQSPKPVLLRSRLAEPMRRALSGLSGTVIGLDYRGEKVLAAHEPVQELGLGIVAKIDLAEVREPFVRAGAVAVGIAILVVLAGAGLFVRISTPIIKDLEERSASLTRANEELNREIAERKSTERALQDSEDLLKKTQEIAHVGSWSLDLKKNELYWSDEVYRIFGLKPQEFGVTYEAFLESVHSKDREMVDKAYARAIQNHTPYDIVHRVLRPDGEVRVVHEKAVDVVDESGKTTRSIGMVHDITARHKAEEALRASEGRYRSYIELTDQLGWTTNANGEVVEDIPTWRKFTGQSKEAVKGWGWSKALHPDDLERTAQIWRKAVSTESEYETEYRILRHDGIYRHFLARGVPVFKADGSVGEWVGTCIDITERKQAEQQIKASLREKEVLLKEIHHRVKNNLQTIASLLNMSSMQTQNEEAKGLLQEARSKVFTMALIHTQLYQEKQFNQIDMGKHVRQLITHLGQTYMDKEKTIRTVIEPSDVRLSINQAIPCGLVLNELVSNAFRHAFEDKHDGKIQVSLRYIESDMVGIKVKDDGIGIPEDVDTDKPKTLGLELVNALVNQLGGTVQFNHDSGTEVNIQFEALKEEEADA